MRRGRVCRVQKRGSSPRLNVNPGPEACWQELDPRHGFERIRLPLPRRRSARALAPFCFRRPYHGRCARTRSWLGLVPMLLIGMAIARILKTESHRFRPKHHEWRRVVPTKSALNHLKSWSNGENRLTPALSSTYWEVPFRPCVFNQLLGGSFIFNIFFLLALFFQ